jgi:hypothetical protein
VRDAARAVEPDLRLVGAGPQDAEQVLAHLLGRILEPARLLNGVAAAEIDLSGR